MGEEPENDKTVVVFDEYGPVRMIRSENYKYIHRFPFGPDEFYDLEKDPDEDCNLIDNALYDAQIQEMKRRMDLWFLKYVNPQIDGAKEPVLGGGQKDMAGTWGPGYKVYNENK